MATAWASCTRSASTASSRPGRNSPRTGRWGRCSARPAAPARRSSASWSTFPTKVTRRLDESAAEARKDRAALHGRVTDNAERISRLEGPGGGPARPGTKKGVGV